MTETGVTAGPWRISPTPDNVEYAEIDGGSRSKAACDWYALANVPVYLDGQPSAEGVANLNFIVSAVNVCFSLSPDHPEDVPFGAAYEILRCSR